MHIEKTIFKAWRNKKSCSWKQRNLEDFITDINFFPNLSCKKLNEEYYMETHQNIL